MKLPKKSTGASSDEMRQKLYESRCKIEELNNCIRSTETEARNYKDSLYTYEEENKRLRAELLDERLAKEEAIQQTQVYEESFKTTERASKDKRNTHQTALKKLELENNQKDQTILDLKTRTKDLEIASMQNEERLRDELELVKDKNNKHLQKEAMLDIYKSRLKEIPELKAKLRQALQTNMEYEDMKGQNEDQEQIEKLQDCIKILKE